MAVWVRCGYAQSTSPQLFRFERGVLGARWAHLLTLKPLLLALARRSAQEEAGLLLVYYMPLACKPAIIAFVAVGMRQRRSRDLDMLYT